MKKFPIKFTVLAFFVLVAFAFTNSANAQTNYGIMNGGGYDPMMGYGAMGNSYGGNFGGPMNYGIINNPMSGQGFSGYGGAMGNSYGPGISNFGGGCGNVCGRQVVYSPIPNPYDCSYYNPCSGYGSLGGFQTGCGSRCSNMYNQYNPYASSGNYASLGAGFNAGFSNQGFNPYNTYNPYAGFGGNSQYLNAGAGFNTGFVW